MSILALVFAYGWILPVLLALVFYKATIRLFGIVIVPDDKVGHVIKKFVLFGAHKALPEGKIIACNGEAGKQAKTLAPGVHYGFWVWQYTIEMESMITIPEKQIGLLSAFDGMPLPAGQILARKVQSDNFQDAEAFLNNGGCRGKQTAILTPGTYRINRYLFNIALAEATIVSKDKVGIVTTEDGAPLPEGEIAGRQIKGHSAFQDPDIFLTNGGTKGVQSEIILAGTYFLNPWFVSVNQIDMSTVDIGNVGVVISYFGNEGQDVSGEKFTHGNIVSRGEKGVWKETLNPGKYPLNTNIYRMQSVPTTNIVLNWATGKNESHKLDSGLSTITVRSKDGFTFNLDVSQIIHIPNTEAPAVIARFGNIVNLITQVLEPTIGNYFRNSAQEFDAIDFLKNRSKRQEEAKKLITSVLAEYNVIAVDTLIGDITLPEELMKTLKDRKIAEELTITYASQKLAEEKRQSLEEQRTVANMKKSVIESEQEIFIADKKADAVVKTAAGEASRLKTIADARAYEIAALAKANAEQINVVGNAEASVIESKGIATAKAYELQVNAMGQDNFAKTKMVEYVGQNNIKITPEVIMSGGNGGPIDGILGVKLAELLGVPFCSNTGQLQHPSSK